MYSNQQKGFSLIELMITISIFAILASFAIPSYQQMIENNKIKNAADAIKDGLQLARAEAVSRNAQVQFDFRGTNSEWAVCLKPVGTRCSTDDADGTIIQSRQAKDGSDSSITINDGGPYVFNSFGALKSPAASATINVNNTQTVKRNLDVLIGLGGSVRVCDPALDTNGTDPRKCP